MARRLSLSAILRNSLLLILASLAWTEAGAAPRKHVIVTSHKLATDAGLEVLRKGGSAVDAAIAAQLVMGLVEPQSSGIGGGAFLVHWNPATKKLETYDGRETAPQSATPNLFIGPDGKALNYIEAVVGGRSVGVPGAIAMLWMAHKEHGLRPWKELFVPAIAIAESGFAVSPRLAAAIARDPALAKLPASAAYFHPGGMPAQPGQIIKNPAYAETLRLIADQGPDGFYKGVVAQAISSAVRNSPRGPVDLTLADLAGYKPIKRDAVCGTYRGYKICGMGPPSSGGVTSLQILKMLERANLAGLQPMSAQAIHLFSEAQRLAFADRAAYLADPAFVAVPLPGMLDPRYLAGRAKLISSHEAMDRTKVAPGNPKGAEETLRRLRIPDNAKPSTAHLSVIDANGNAVALTTTVEGPFGSHLMAAGFFLNNQLTDFAIEPGTDNRRFANAPEAGKRPLSSMSPTLVFDAKGKLFAIVGSPGGWRIIPYVTKTLIGLIDWKLDMASAIALPNVTTRNGPMEIEANRYQETAAAALRAMGHEVTLNEQTSGLNAIRITPDGFDAAADKRREGTVGGD